MIEKTAISPNTKDTMSGDGQIEISSHAQLVRVPLVSVLMITYNHADYLAEAIESVVTQLCDFPFELIIGEDASTDNTRMIALQYQQKYPEIIRLVYSAGNVGMKANAQRIFSIARGEYVAYCEGDDYWCAKNKLARQLELIRHAPEIAVVHTDWVRSRHEPDGWRIDWNKSVHRRVPKCMLEGDLFRTFHYPTILRTCTTLYRRSAMQECLASRLANKGYQFMDALMAAYVTSKWRVAYLPEITAVYRLSSGSALRSGTQARLTFLKSGLEFDTDARHYFSDRSDYPCAYRWELSVGLFLWAIRAHDALMIRFAWADIRAHFGIFGFVKAAWQTLCMRRPSLYRQHRAALQTSNESSTQGPSA